MTQTVILTIAILASLLVGWYLSDAWHRARITQLKAEAAVLEDVIVEQRRRIWNLTRDEMHA